MKKGIINMMTMLLIGWSASSFAAEKTGKDGLIRKPYHFNIGYNLNKYIITGFDDDFVSTDLAHGAQIAFDWQGNGRLGVYRFRLPIIFIPMFPGMKSTWGRI